MSESKAGQPRPTSELLRLAFEENDARGWEELLEKFLSYVASAVRRRFNGRPGATEVIQEVLLALVKKRDSQGRTPETRQQFKAFLSRLVNNKVVDAVRRGKLRRHASLEQLQGEDGADLSELATEKDDPQAAAERRDEDEWVLAAVQRFIEGLPNRQKDVARLCLLQRLSPQEVSAELGFEVRTVQQRLASVKRGLQELLRAVWEGER